MAMKNPAKKMAATKTNQQERVVFGPNVNTQQPPSYGKSTPPTGTSLR